MKLLHTILAFFLEDTDPVRLFHIADINHAGQLHFRAIMKWTHTHVVLMKNILDGILDFLPTELIFLH